MIFLGNNFYIKPGCYPLLASFFPEWNIIIIMKKPFNPTKDVASAIIQNKKAARSARLLYVVPGKKGITRVKKGKTFTYWYKGKAVTRASELERIMKLVIPPAWTEVWVCPSPRGHIQATGIDAMGRKQYRYHSSWNTYRNNSKFHRLYEFGKVLPLLRKKTKKDMAGMELTCNKVIATAINLMEETYIRVGNNSYEKTHGSYGLTTLKDSHVDITKDSVKFCFVGKKGIQHTINLKNKKLARLIKQCRDIPGKQLFQYYDKDGRRKTIDSGMVNNYLKESSEGMDISSKDFRTWAGTLQALKSISKLEPTEKKSAIKQNLVEVLDEVSAKLGNTRTVCKKYYVHPAILQMYEDGELPDSLKQLPVSRKKKLKGLTTDESMLMTVLKKTL
jgi:DNA topoisomerase-1